MVAVCEKCGSIGFTENLVYCSRCRDSVEHRYCLDEYPNVGKPDELVWTCPDCVSVNIERSERVVTKRGQIAFHKQQNKCNRGTILAASTGVGPKITASGSCLLSEGKFGHIGSRMAKKLPTADRGPQKQFKSTVKLDQKSFPNKENSLGVKTVTKIQHPVLNRNMREMTSHGDKTVPAGQRRSGIERNPGKPKRRLIVSDEESDSVTNHNLEKVPEVTKRDGYSSDNSRENLAFRAARRKSQRPKTCISESSLSEEQPEPTGGTSDVSVAMEEVGDSGPLREKDKNLNLGGKGVGILNGLDRCSNFEPHGSKFSESRYGCYTSDDGPHHLNLSESSKDLGVYPLTDPTWRGWFNISKREKDTLFRLGAYLSNHACPKACDAGRDLRPMLRLEIMPKSEIWPDIFRACPPTVEAVALFFFPEYESDEAVFDDVLDEMMGQGLAMRSVFSGFDLLIFSSLEFPHENWRICRKYYMWGVFQETGGP